MGTVFAVDCPCAIVVAKITRETEFIKQKSPERFSRASLSIPRIRFRKVIAERLFGTDPGDAVYP